MDYGLFIKIANTGNNINGGFECPIQIATMLLKFSSDQSMTDIYSNIPYQLNEIVMPDELVLDNSAMYCGISNKLLQSKSFKKFSEVAPGWSRMISKFGNKNIYIVGWDILEDDLRILENNLKRLSVVVPEFNKFRIIDIKKLAELLIPISEVGTYGIDAITYHLSKDISLEFGILNSYRSNRYGEKFCEKLLRQSIYCLLKLSKLGNLHNLDDIYNFMQKPHKLEVLPFGKHRGEKFVDVFQSDNSYLCWLHSCKEIMDKNKDLKYTLDELLSI